MITRRMFHTALSIFLLIAFVPIQAQAQSLTQILKPACPHLDSNFMYDKSFLQSLPPECITAFQGFTQNSGIQVRNTDITPLAIGGPDTFGYTYDDTVSYSWISATTNSGLTGDDVFSDPVNIGFNFPFYGITQSQLYFSTNGLITFGDGYRWSNGGQTIPATSFPNNFIAPFTEDLLVGSPYNSGAIYYSQNGIAPNRYFVIEWRTVTTFSDTSPFSFEVILHENGDIVTQIQSLPASYNSTVGIENSTGEEGLEYQSGTSGLIALKAVYFYYPVTSTARVNIFPLQSSKFVSASGTTDFVLTISNSGSMGADTYDLTATATWPVIFYAADGVTLLTDTDSDFAIDTGSVSQGATATVVARFSPPIGTTIGTKNTTAITATSSLNVSKNKTASFGMVVPPRFTLALDDANDTASLLFTGGLNGEDVFSVDSDNLGRYGQAITPNPNGKYLYTWSRSKDLGGVFVSEIEYALARPNGSVVRPTTKLTNNSGATLNTYDSNPSVAAAQNGNMAVLWERQLYNSVTDQFNDNIYLAILDGMGNILAGPTNLTNNSVWGTYSTLNVPSLVYPTVAATDDNHFVVVWQDFREVSTNVVQSDFWYGVYNTTGSMVFAPALLTTDHNNYVPTLNSLTNGNVILTYKDVTPADNRSPYYMIIKSNGTIVKTQTSLGIGHVPNYPTDATLLPNGKIAAAWGTTTGVAYSILSASYDLESGPYTANNPISGWGSGLSVTTDPDNHVILTWFDFNNELLYALGNTSGSFITPPTAYRTNYSGSTNMNGQGNAPYIKFGDVPPTYWSASWIERLANAGITSGCGTDIYCPDSTVTRAQMAVFLLKGIHGSSYTPPAVGASTGFTDIALDYWAAAWVKQLAAEGITSGCGAGNYCPEATVTRAQMAIFLLKAKYGPGYTPSSATGIFTDVEVGYWADKWIEQLAAEGITGGCGAGIYCPEADVTRAQMAVFLVKDFNLP